MSTQRFRRRVERGERGVALVEFALVLPVFMTLVLGMFSGGMAYDRKISLTNAAREGARYGATLAPGGLPLSSSFSTGIDEWVREVADAVEQNADGDLGATAPNRRICVAYVHPDADAGPHNMQSHMLVRTTGADPPPTFGSSARCFGDTRQNDEPRVQIEVSRGSDIELLFFDVPVTLTARSVTRMESTKF